MNKIIDGIITLQSPLIHGADEKMGVDTKFRRLAYIVDGAVEWIPTVSGNSIRGVMRRLIANDFIQRLGMDKTGISDKIYYMFFSGGALEKGSIISGIDVGARREFREKIPFMSIFGGSVGNQIMAGKMIVDNAVPTCKETSINTGIESSLSYWDLLQEIYLTRRDDLEDKEATKNATQMKYSMECLHTGVRLKHGFTLMNCNDVETACFYQALYLWIQDGYLGGKSSIGMGKFSAEYTNRGDVQLYLDYVEQNKVVLAEYVRKIDGGHIKEMMKATQPKKKGKEKLPLQNEWLDNDGE